MLPRRSKAPPPSPARTPSDTPANQCCRAAACGRKGACRSTPWTILNEGVDGGAQQGTANHGAGVQGVQSTGRRAQRAEGVHTRRRVCTRGEGRGAWWRRRRATARRGMCKGASSASTTRFAEQATTGGSPVDPGESPVQRPALADHLDVLPGRESRSLRAMDALRRQSRHSTDTVTTQ